MRCVESPDELTWLWTGSGERRGCNAKIGHQRGHVFQTPRELPRLLQELCIYKDWPPEQLQFTSQYLAEPLVPPQNISRALPVAD